MRCVAKGCLFLYSDLGTAGHFFVTATNQLTTLERYVLLCFICHFIFL